MAGTRRALALAFLIDTNVAIYLRDGEPSVAAKMRELGPPLALSIVSRVELENGVYKDPKWTAERRATLDKILTRIMTIEFGELELAGYRSIVETIGYSRARVSDRMIAATALVHDFVVVTMNGGDFRDVPGLRLEVWPSPSA